MTVEQEGDHLLTTQFVIHFLPSLSIPLPSKFSLLAGMTSIIGLLPRFAHRIVFLPPGVR